MCKIYYYSTPYKPYSHPFTLRKLSTIINLQLHSSDALILFDNGNEILIRVEQVQNIAKIFHLATESTLDTVIYHEGILTINCE